MKILFILPAIGKKNNKKYIGTWKMEPLTIATLKAITPSDVETYFFDDRIENIDYKIDIDIVSICCEAYTAQRAYDIADKFKKLGKFIVLGGYHATALPSEALEHADSIITGNAESVWEEFINDFGSF